MSPPVLNLANPREFYGMRFILFGCPKRLFWGSIPDNRD